MDKAKTKNKIVNTEFLTIYQKDIIKKELNRLNIKDYLFFGGYDGAEGECLILYPEKLSIDIVQNNLNNILKTVQIKLPKELYGKYTHRDYLGACMQAGLNRNRIGDIVVYEDMAYIIVLNENAEYMVDYLKELIKFSKSEIKLLDYYQIKPKEIEFESINIVSSSMRLDCIISEIVKTSRNKVEKLLSEEKIFVNSRNEIKGTKFVKESDILVIRGIGKFIIYKILGKNKKGKTIIEVKKYK